jgi:hypothetical protein
MNQNGREPLELTVQQMVERYREQKRKGRALVEGMFREAVEREREQKQRQRDLTEQVHREAIEQSRLQCFPPHEPAVVHYTALPPAQPNSQLSEEWDFYRREVPRLLAEGEEGRFVLIKGEEIIGIWDTAEEAEAVAFHKYPLGPRLIHQIQRCERVLPGPSRFWRCPS